MLLLCLLIPQGCVTQSLWEAGRPEGPSAGHEHGAVTALKVLGTPLTLAIDVTLIVTAVWVWAETRDLEHSGHDCD